MVFAPDNPPPSTSINTIQWHFGTNIILTAQSGSAVIAPAYRDRVSFDRNTLALELWNLRLGDSGKYKLTVISTDGQQLTGETSLQVFGECLKIYFLVHLPQAMVLISDLIKNICEIKKKQFNML